ncbi:hypothetical protein M441DRAFT_320132 [Trichoderma asperellum CBS 433.97]|uniref:Uncharacterized protein n=1 Tax=Trichoderma asperellum (strain ATCC 204424 / CBS 433.97 / NBRC 101777) TaxID=1042311 RepID=A0A2T3ZL57_TRIA4|nr:hypothetical protein M441DRAFT_320132 [Trichoderma asperellum CBS 433.97]PTB45541.1 hypothetical protein M441DRAFT_320132 [Trichoderma asperellum CBS 433.97]
MRKSGGIVFYCLRSQLPVETYDGHMPSCLHHHPHQYRIVCHLSITRGHTSSHSYFGSPSTRLMFVFVFVFLGLGLDWLCTFDHFGWSGSLFYSLARAVLRFRWMDEAGSRTCI